MEYKQLQPDFQKGDKISIIRPQSCLRQRVKKQVKMSIDILGTVGRGNISAEFHVLQQEQNQILLFAVLIVGVC